MMIHETINRHCLRQTRSVCARERSDEAIHSHRLLGEMDCFAALAMTEKTTRDTTEDTL